MRLDDGTFLATPTGISKSFITTDKLVRIDGEGNVLDAMEGYRPSSEIKMHLRCYKVRSDVGSVLHAHPPTATGFAVAHIPLDRYCMIETVIAVGSPVTPYGTSSTNEVPDRTVAQNIWMGRKPLLPMKGVHLINHKNVLEETEKLLSEMEMDINPNALMSSLSISMQRSAKLQRLISCGASIVVMDEPASSLSEKVEKLTAASV